MRGIGSFSLKLLALLFLSPAPYSATGQVNRSKVKVPISSVAPVSGDAHFAGAPLVQNYSKTSYQAGNQNWSASYGPDGRMYFANSDGLLSFDGQHWNQSTMPGKILVRAVAAGKDGKVYTGGFGQFGVWERDSFGQLVYHSLSDQLKAADKLHDEIWKIYVDEEKVLFQSFSAIYTYQDGKLSVLKTKDPFLFLYQVNKRYVVEIISKGLFEFKEGKLIKLVDKERYGNSIVLSILPFDSQRLLIGTAKSGLFLFENGSVKPWNNEADKALRQYQLNNGLKVLGNRYVFGTILNGVYILDQTGKLIQHINKSNGLQNNTVLSLQKDTFQNIWAGLDNGIDRIEINSPIYYFDDRAGILGTVYTSKIYEGRLYIGTNQGLYYSKWPATNNRFDFHLVEGSQGQVWELYSIGDDLLCGHNNGTFRVNGDKLQWLSTVTGGYSLHTLSDKADSLIQGTYTGLALFKRSGKGWEFDQKIRNFNEPVQYLQQLSNQRFWVSGYKGLYALQLNNDKTVVQQQKKYTEEDGLPQSLYINVFDLAGRVVFATDSGFYLHDEIADRFHAYSQLNERLGTFANANKVVPAADGKYWFIRKGHLALVSFGEGGRVNIDSTGFTVLNNRMLSFYENVNLLTPNLSLISLDDGFALYRRTADTKRAEINAPIIRKIEDIADSTARPIAFYKVDDVILTAKQNNIRITYALPHFSINAVQFQYQLDGNAKNWSAWSAVTQKEFTNLSPGQYIFRVRAKINGRISPESLLAFEIAAPWYQSGAAWIIYTILFLLLLYGARRYYLYKLKKHQEETQKQMLHEQEERLQKEMLENEQRLFKLKNTQLEKELAGKNRELANSAMNIVYKNELLNNVHDELLQLKDADGRKLSTDQLKRISKIIDDARSDERDWNLFEESFNEAHENFFKKLKTNYPELVPNDLKLCAYLRMNMSSKEIASLLNISTRGVEIRRYRLRKKLNLEHDQNLTEFLMGI
ncbi:triple tyrosine motif-containing protein [Olivibacter sp. XZL3]|uniref:ligand-binding sensor domain-containing protein n=1 Tax=Olivibacter sp. XZL3 TaxID=1735116 RepID=UPI0010666540|nr:triple tyrosine motif-containing protein [Olivibacter sp. XZL3]